MLLSEDGSVFGVAPAISDFLIGMTAEETLQERLFYSHLHGLGRIDTVQLVETASASSEVHVSTYGVKRASEPAQAGLFNN